MYSCFSYGLWSLGRDMREVQLIRVSLFIVYKLGCLLEIRGKERMYSFGTHLYP